MPRKPRVLYPDAIYHVYSRGNCKKIILKDNQDFETFFNICKFAREKYNFNSLSRCAMNNHYHFLIQTPDANLPEIMQCINQTYAQYYNEKYKEFGYVFQGRYQAKLVEDEKYFYQLLAYIHANPVEAKLVVDPGDWAWSSYQAILGNAKKYTFDNFKALAERKISKEIFRDLVEKQIERTKVQYQNKIFQELCKIDDNELIKPGKKKLFKLSYLLSQEVPVTEFSKFLKCSDRSVKRLLNSLEETQDLKLKI